MGLWGWICEWSKKHKGEQALRTSAFCEEGTQRFLSFFPSKNTATTTVAHGPSPIPSQFPSLFSQPPSDDTNEYSSSSGANAVPSKDFSVEDKTTNCLSPIQYEQHNKEYTQLIGQDNYDGFRLEAAKTVTSSMQASHSLLLGTTLRDSGYLYQFGPTLAFEDASLLIMARYGSDKTMTARAVRKFNPFLEGRISLSSCLDSEQRNVLELALDTSGGDWALGTKLVWQGTWVTNVGFNQVIAPNLHLGGDITWISGTGATTGSVGLRYTLGNSHIISAMITRQPNFKSIIGLTENMHNYKIQYVRKVSDRLNLGAELELSQASPKNESALRFGYEYIFRQARIQGSIDADGKVSMAAQNSKGFGLSGVIDYWRGDYKFGFMMQVMPPPEGVPPIQPPPPTEPTIVK